jgi:hypothetical protein
MGMRIHTSLGLVRINELKPKKGLAHKKRSIGGSYYENRSFHLSADSLTSPLPPYFGEGKKIRYLFQENDLSPF